MELAMNRIFFLTLLVAFCAPSIALSQSPRFMTIDAGPRQFTGVANGARLTLRVSGNRSFCCSVARTDGISSIAEITGFGNFGAMVPVARGIEIPGLQSEASRYCWIDNEPGLYSAGRQLTLGNISGTADIDAACEETTLFGNYNTSVSEFNFLELTVRTGAGVTTVAGTIRLQSATTGATVLRQFSISTGGVSTDTVRQDIAIHDAIGGIADFGDIRIFHNGAPGQVSARVSQYDVTSTSPLNFTLVGQDVLRRSFTGQ